jgi:formamidase
MSRLFVLLFGFVPAIVLGDVIIGGEGFQCSDDAACITRLHPEIPMVATAAPGERIVMKGRDAGDREFDPDDLSNPDKIPGAGFGVVHPLVGPVHIDGAQTGDILAVTIEAIEPGPFGWTATGDFGFAADRVGAQEAYIVWRLNRDFAETDALPGVRIPNASFPGVVTTLPSPEQLQTSLEREQQLADAGGDVFLPSPDVAEPSSLCGAEGTRAGECLRTLPPREFGGNLDIRYLKTGVTIYLPCNIDGCGLAIGDFHYAQGDGEVSGTAIEMDADITVTTQVLKNGPDLSHGPHYSGSSALLSIPSMRFHATTGFPIKERGEIPRDIAYLASEKVAELTNLSKDFDLAAANALVAMIDYIVGEYGYDRTQAYLIASVAVDIRVAQLVDAPNVGATAILPLDIFIDEN